MCLSANRLSFSELFDDVSLVLNLRRLFEVVDSLIYGGPEGSHMQIKNVAAN